MTRTSLPPSRSTAVSEAGPGWATPLLFAAVAGLALLAASLDAAFAAAAEGRRVSATELGTPLREAARLLLCQRRTTVAADTVVWRFGASAVAVLAFLAAAVVPIAGPAVVDLHVGVVWWTAVMALLWVAVYLVGWGVNSAYALIGGYRYVAQALAYEMPLAITVITVAVAAESLRVGDVVAAQQRLWFVLWMPVGFAIYLACAVALAFWGPFDTPVGRDLAGGAVVELSGVDRLVLLAGRYLVLVVAAAFAVPMFLGGGAGPLLPDWLWSLLKTVAVVALLVTAKWRLPTIRMDRFEEFAWVVLIPVALVQLFGVCVVVLLAEA